MAIPIPGETLDRLAERYAICDTLAVYCEALDRYDVDAAAAVFTPDCTTDFGPGGGGVLHGSDAFAARVKVSQARFARTHHQLGQVRIGFAGTGAESVAYIMAMHVLTSGERLDLYMQYHDRWVSAGGGWRIASRTVLNAIRYGDAPGTQDDWYWVPRLTKEAAGGVV